ncbi:type 1 glutamine amidotransferase domain-containing protein [Vulgatibacter incomptus]|uniref:ThiJ/PfpI family protein n=1 Tax=Vulgatibacter incomptus TaxID=1391653 RepID=A0A0K1P9D1_9BACT|nr:type 1 glutamine amidotransferase domain-containing protein [Vulgatibacter incomptus]AKU90031.1 ThiJ/PfpI family protein [Vulgatibacter incomptus]
MQNAKPRILLIATSHASLGATGRKTGLWLEELAAPYVALKGHAKLEIATPSGGRPPIDPRSQEEPTEDMKAFLADEHAMGKLAQTRRLDDLGDDVFDAVLVVGGHGPMWDLANSLASEQLSKTYRRKAVVAAVCHGPAAFVGAVKPDGEPLLRGHRVTSFTNEEEVAVGLADVVPFLLETKLRELGARYENGPAWKPHVVRDGHVVTGQNPASARGVAHEILEALKAWPM